MGNGMDIGFWELLLRVLLIYLMLLVSMRIMGKREIGQLSNLDFVVAIVVAELATLPLTDRNLTLLHSVIPMLILTALQVSASMLCLKSNWFRRILYGKPDLLIAAGRLQMREMRKARYNIDMPADATGYELLEAAGRKRGFLMARAEVNTERMAKVLLDEYRSGKLGKFTLEMPPKEEHDG